MQPGTVVDDRYTLTRLLGEGGFGSVWQATDGDTGRDVAIKFLTARLDDAAQRRFRLEAQALGRVQHPNCVTLFDYGQSTSGEFHLVTELVDGLPLDAWAKVHRDDLARIVGVARQVASALDAIHQAGLIHRDLKPPNILVSSSNGEDVIKVLDFGIVKLTGRDQPDITKTGEVFGTPGYMSPEHLRGRELTASTDLYSLGVLLFETLDGRKLFSGDSALEIAMRHIAESRPTLQRDVPPRLRRLVADLIEQSPEARPRSARAVFDALGRYEEPLQPRPARTEPAPEPRPPNKGPSKRLLAALVALVALIALAALVAIDGFLTAPDPEPTPAPVRRIATDGRGQLIAGSAETAKTDETDGPTPVPDVGAPDPDHPCYGLPSFERGNRHLRDPSRRPLAVRVPGGYSPTREYPVIIGYHDALQDPMDLLNMVAKMAPVALDNYVLIAPAHEDLNRLWEKGPARRAAIADLKFAATQMCLDLDQVYGFGHGGGGNAVEMLPCEFEGTVAIASSGHRLGPRDPTCKPERPVPYLFVSPLDDPVEPQKGGKDCMGYEKWPVVKHVNHLLRAQQCEKPRRIVDERMVADGRCFEFACEAPLVSCRVPGGRDWPSRKANPITKTLFADCGSEPGNFPYGDELFGFFESVRTTAP